MKPSLIEIEWGIGLVKMNSIFIVGLEWAMSIVYSHGFSIFSSSTSFSQMQMEQLINREKTRPLKSPACGFFKNFLWNLVCLIFGSLIYVFSAFHT